MPSPSDGDGPSESYIRDEWDDDHLAGASIEDSPFSDPTNRSLRVFLKSFNEFFTFAKATPDQDIFSEATKPEDFFTVSGLELTFGIIIAYLSWWTSRAVSLKTFGRISYRTVCARITMISIYLRLTTTQVLDHVLSLQVHAWVRKTLVPEYHLTKNSPAQPWLDTGDLRSLFDHFFDSRYKTKTHRFRLQLATLCSILVEQTLRCGSLMPTRNSDKSQKALTWGDMKVIIHRGDNGSPNSITIPFTTVNGKTASSSNLRVILTESAELKFNTVFLVLALAQCVGAFPTGWTFSAMKNHVFPSSQDRIELAFASGSKDRPVFYGNSTDITWDTTTMDTMFGRIAYTFGWVPTLATHIFRRSGILFLYRRGVPVEKIQQQLQHVWGSSTWRTYLSNFIRVDISAANYGDINRTEKMAARHPNKVTRDLVVLGPEQYRIILQEDELVDMSRQHDQLRKSRLRQYKVDSTTQLPEAVRREISTSYEGWIGRFEQYARFHRSQQNGTHVKLDDLVPRTDTGQASPAADQGAEEITRMNLVDEQDERNSGAAVDYNLKTFEMIHTETDPHMIEEQRADQGVCQASAQVDVPISTATGTPRPDNALEICRWILGGQSGLSDTEAFDEIVEICNKDPPLAYRPGHSPTSNNHCPVCGINIEFGQNKFEKQRVVPRARHLNKCYGTLQYQTTEADLVSKFLDQLHIGNPFDVPDPDKAIDYDVWRWFKKIRRIFYDDLKHPRTCQACGDDSPVFANPDAFHEHVHVKHQVWMPRSPSSAANKRAKAHDPLSGKDIGLPSAVYYMFDDQYHSDPLDIVQTCQRIYQERFVDTAVCIEAHGPRTDIIIPADMLADQRTDLPPDDRHLVVMGSAKLVEKEGYCVLCMYDPDLAWTQRVVEFNMDCSDAHHVPCLKIRCKRLKEFREAIVAGETVSNCYMWEDDRVYCPELVCRRNGTTFDDEFGLVRHLVMVHMVRISGRGRKASPILKTSRTLDELSFTTLDSMHDWFSGDKSKTAGPEDTQGQDDNGDIRDSAEVDEHSAAVPMAKKTESGPADTGAVNAGDVSGDKIISDRANTTIGKVRKAVRVHEVNKRTKKVKRQRIDEYDDDDDDDGDDENDDDDVKAVDDVDEKDEDSLDFDDDDEEEDYVRIKNRLPTRRSSRLAASQAGPSAVHTTVPKRKLEDLSDPVESASGESDSQDEWRPMPKDKGKGKAKFG